VGVGGADRRHSDEDGGRSGIIKQQREKEKNQKISINVVAHGGDPVIIVSYRQRQKQKSQNSRPDVMEL
jgi:aspartate 1-decarboxylase